MLHRSGPVAADQCFGGGGNGSVGKEDRPLYLRGDQLLCVFFLLKRFLRFLRPLHLPCADDSGELVQSVQKIIPCHIRFQHIIPRPLGESIADKLEIRVVRKGQHLALEVFGTQVVDQLNAVHARHFQICHDNVHRVVF